jgi:hypothetical protein
MTDEYFFGVFYQDRGMQEYLVAIKDDENSAREQASRLDELTFEMAQDEGEEPNWVAYDGLYYVEPVSPELVEFASNELELGFAVAIS